ncbi:hypothetical protein LOTGIDRAFT_172088 [Lottia gigantea]|uniref:Uncharacterized protein n=1 Tax=Lottia gigantea TaxID=225164 RepID=V4B4M9_LOTGI|nr:hypothetical protein LOTGIDRAFT_172088 [Lottia gigantea]ESP02431.1 hypothetical protein LOTGIDRAFT_172088 [Lottia gigantea]
MDSQEDPRKLTKVRGNEDFYSKNRTEISSSPTLGPQTEDSVMNLHGEIARPVLQRQLDCLTEEDEDVDYPPPRLITGLPEPITVDDHTENLKPINPEISSLKAPCLLFTTEEIKKYIDQLETKLKYFHQKMQEAEIRINNQQSLLDQQEDELIFYRKFHKTGKNDANEFIPEEYERLETPPEAEFRKYSFGKKLKVEMNPTDVDPDIKEAVDRRIQEILNKTELSPGSSLPSHNSFQNIIYINHEFDDEMLNPTSPRSCESPVLFIEADTSSIQDHDKSVDTLSPENSALRNATSNPLEPGDYEGPSQFQEVHTIREQTDMKPTLEDQAADQLLQQSKSSQDPYKSINIQECGTGMKYDIPASPSPNPEVNIREDFEFQQIIKSSGVENEENKLTEQLENDQVQANDVQMTQEEQQLIEELEKYVGIYEVSFESFTDTHNEFPMVEKMPYIDIGSVLLKLETSEPTDLIAPSKGKHVKKLARKTEVEIENGRRPVKSAYRKSTYQSMLSSIESKKIDLPIVSDFNTRIPLPDISTTGYISHSSSRRAAETRLLVGNESVSKINQLDRRGALPQIRAGYSRKPHYQDVDVSSLPKLNPGYNKSNTKTNCQGKDEEIVLPQIKSTSLSTPTVSNHNLRQRIKSSLLPDMTKSEKLPSILSINTSRQAKASTSSVGKSQGFTKSATFKQPKVLLPVQPNLYQSNRRKERRPGKLPPICNLGLDDNLVARKD